MLCKTFCCGRLIKKSDSKRKTIISCYRSNTLQTDFFTKDIIVDDFVLKIIDYMESKLYGRFTMSELAREFSFGKTYISKYFMRVTGYSIINYFTIMKVNEAKRLIRESSHNFSEISEMLMFSNSHYFSTVFKKHTNMSPSQYKNLCKKD